MYIQPMQIEAECEACNHKQIVKVQITTLNVTDKNPDKIVEDLVKTFEDSEKH